MKYIEYDLLENGYINRFLRSEICTQKKEFEKAVLKGKINEWLKHGFAIHENPCRKEFFKERKNNIPEYIDLTSDIKDVKVFGQNLNTHIYFPFGNVGVDSSGFYYVPTYLRSYHYAIIKSENEKEAELELSTCGGMTLWINGELARDFIPFTRNMVKSETIKVTLKKGENVFVVCLDDLAERDTDYYFRIRVTGNEKLKIKIPVSENTDITKLYKKEMMLQEMCFEKETYISEDVKLSIENTLNEDIKVNVKTAPGNFVSKMKNAQLLISEKKYVLKKGKSEINLLHSDELVPGYRYFGVELTENDIVIGRKIGNQLVKKDFLEHSEENHEKRKDNIKDIILSLGADNVYKSAVLFSLNKDLDKAEQIIFDELPGVFEKQDCSDFHFVIILYIYQKHMNQLSKEMKDLIEEAMRTYRYWIDEPGNDVMWFFSENHALLFHICQYLAGKFMPDVIFENSGLTGNKLREKAIGLLDDWFEGFFEEFITEWNSNAYIPVDVLGLGTLYNLTDENDALHEKAKKALDMIFYSLCVNSHKGAVMTSFGRTYEKELKGNYNAGTTSLLYLAYNAGFLNAEIMGCLPLVLGDYIAPEEYKQYLCAGKGKALIFQNTQGFEQHVNFYLYKNENVCLSSAIGYTPFEAGYQEHVVQATIDEVAQVFINHPGEFQPYGNGRPNFWVGNGNLPMVMQFENTAILKYDIPKSNQIDYTHAYIPINEFEQYMGDYHTIVVEKDGGYIGVKALNGLTRQQKGVCKYKEFISEGRENIWIVRVEKAERYVSLRTFFEEFSNVEFDYKNDGSISVDDTKGKVYRIDKQNKCFLNGEELYDYPLNPKGIIEIKQEE